MITIKEKIKEIGEIPVPLKTVVIVLAVTILVIRPPMTWVMIKK